MIINSTRNENKKENELINQNNIAKCGEKNNKILYRSSKVKIHMIKTY